MASLSGSTGLFRDGPFVGLHYAAGGRTGVTDQQGRFQYLAGDVITFSIGTLELGTVAAAPTLTVRDLAGAGATQSLRDPAVTNRARFLQSFEAEPDLRDGVTITREHADAVSRVASAIDFAVDAATFERNPAVAGLFAGLGLRLRGAAEARNHLRRSLSGIRLLRDVEIPTRDGSFLSADVFLPAAGGAFPSVLRLGVYGKAFGNGSAVTQEQQDASDEREDFWFEEDRSSLPAFNRYFENMVSVNTSSWVPRGYAVVRVDGRGIGKSPGTVSPLSRQEAEDYYDAIQWVAGQSWSDGRVGLAGASYNATNQWAVAAMRPPALKAIIPFASDQDGYRELAYPGGIYYESYRKYWYDQAVLTARPNGQGPAADFLAGLKSHPFDGDFWTNDRDAPLGTDLRAIEVPVMTAVSQTMMLHGRAGFEIFRELKDRVPAHLLVVDATYYSYMTEDTVEDQLRFMDKYLKGSEVDDLPAVRMILRKGDGQIEWRQADTWPLPSTRYTDMYLDATDGSARWGPASTAGSVEYSAGAEDIHPRPGARFYGEPLEEDLQLAGHFTARIWLSSSAPDADVYVALRVYDGDREVLYPTREAEPSAPLTWGFLKASHRKLDARKSLPERPWHTHTEADHAPLAAGEVVELIVELLPATALVKAGHRFRIDVTAMEGPGGMPGLPRFYDPLYHAGATNTVHTGASHASSLTLPVIPAGSFGGQGLDLDRFKLNQLGS